MRAHRVFMTEPIEWNPRKEKIDREAQDQKDSFDKIFNVISDQFEPALSITDADLQLSTEEIHRKIVQHYPVDFITIDLVYEKLDEEGFKAISPKSKLDFIWLLKKRSATVL